MVKKLLGLRQSSFLSGYKLPRRPRHAIMKCPMPGERCVSTTKSLLYHVMFNLMIRNISDDKIFLNSQIGSSRKRESISDTRHYRTTENRHVYDYHPYITEKILKNKQTNEQFSRKKYCFFQKRCKTTSKLYKIEPFKQSRLF